VRATAYRHLIHLPEGSAAPPTTDAGRYDAFISCAREDRTVAISPASLDSEHCQQELDQAAALNKLIIPVYCCRTDERRLPTASAG
jgi:hypothetical protein